MSDSRRLVVCLLLSALMHWWVAGRGFNPWPVKGEGRAQALQAKLSLGGAQEATVKGNMSGRPSFPNQRRIFERKGRASDQEFYLRHVSAASDRLGTSYDDSDKRYQLAFARGLRAVLSEQQAGLAGELPEILVRIGVSAASDQIEVVRSSGSGQQDQRWRGYVEAALQVIPPFDTLRAKRHQLPVLLVED